MDAFLETLHSALGRNEAVIAHGTAALGTAANHDRLVARELAAALDRAVQLGQWKLADRIASQSMRIARDHPLLSERVARIRASQGDFDAALAIMDSCTNQTASMCLLRVVCQLQTGRHIEAHAGLLHWARKSSAPLQARVMLAMLDWQAGYADDAATTLQHSLRQIEDPMALAALMLMAVAQSRRQLANHWAMRLAAASVSSPHRRYFETMLSANGFRPATSSMMINDESIASLSTQLIANEHVIPTLVEAQRLAQPSDATHLLAAAIESAIDELEHLPTACHALSMLHEKLSHHDLAQAWRSRAAAALADRADVIASIGRHGVHAAHVPAEHWKEKAA